MSQIEEKKEVRKLEKGALWKPSEGREKAGTPSKHHPGSPAGPAPVLRSS